MPCRNGTQCLGLQCVAAKHSGEVAFEAAASDLLVNLQLGRGGADVEGTPGAAEEFRDPRDQRRLGNLTGKDDSVTAQVLGNDAVRRADTEMVSQNRLELRLSGTPPLARMNVLIAGCRSGCSANSESIASCLRKFVRTMTPSRSRAIAPRVMVLPDVNVQWPTNSARWNVELDHSVI